VVTIDSFDQSDSREQQRKGRFRSGQASTLVAGVNVELEWTAFARGRQRAWYRCPRCNARMAVLLILDQGNIGCRHCLNLLYRSQLENALGKACLQADKIRRKLGRPPGIANPIGSKPKWMRWATFWRLMDRYCRYTKKALAGLVNQKALIPR
jgi:hypothetical protein